MKFFELLNSFMISFFYKENNSVNNDDINKIIIPFI